MVVNKFGVNVLLYLRLLLHLMSCITFASIVTDVTTGMNALRCCILFGRVED